MTEKNLVPTFPSLPVDVLAQVEQLGRQVVHHNPEGEEKKDSPREWRERQRSVRGEEKQLPDEPLARGLEELRNVIEIKNKQGDTIAILAQRFERNDPKAYSDYNLILRKDGLALKATKEGTLTIEGADTLVHRMELEERSDKKTTDPDLLNYAKNKKSKYFDGTALKLTAIEGLAIHGHDAGYTLDLSELPAGKKLHVSHVSGDSKTVLPANAKELSVDYDNFTAKMLGGKNIREKNYTHRIVAGIEALSSATINTITNAWPIGNDENRPFIVVNQWADMTLGGAQIKLDSSTNATFQLAATKGNRETKPFTLFETADHTKEVEGKTYYLSALDAAILADKGTSQKIVKAFAADRVKDQFEAAQKNLEAQVMELAKPKQRNPFLDR